MCFRDCISEYIMININVNYKYLGLVNTNTLFFLHLIFYNESIILHLIGSSQIEFSVRKSSLFFWVFFFLVTWPLKFPGQGLNLRHSSNPSHCCDNARFLIPLATGELLVRNSIILICPIYSPISSINHQSA